MRNKFLMNTTILSFFSSFLLGALHSLEPGHGKSIIALHSSKSKNIKDGLAMLLSLLITHFSLVIVIALTFYFIPSIQNSTFITLIAPIIIICYGLFLLIRKSKTPEDFVGCSCSHTDEENKKLHKKDQITMGILAGLTPCPSVFSPIIISMSTNSFDQIFVYILAYISGVVSVFLIIYVVFYFLGSKASLPFNNLTKSFNPHIISGALMIAIGFFYLFIHFSHEGHA